MRFLVQNHRGFTLVELIAVIGLFGLISSLLMKNLFSIYHFREVIRFKKEINFETASVLNNGIAGLIRSGFAINYGDTVFDKSDGTSDSLLAEVDRLSIFTDRAETQSFTLYREPYVASGVNGDTARLMIHFNNGEEFPLNSSEVVIEDFDVRVPADPKHGGDLDIQPYVQLQLKARHRYPLDEATDEAGLMAHQTIRTSYRTAFALRNTVPSSSK